MRPVLIAGPTASGKSALALALAQRDGGIVINADALQVYADWRALTARPSAAEEAAAPHRLYGHVPLEAPYSAGQWLREVRGVLDGRRPIVVGGTGLYFLALTEGLAEIPETPAEIRAEADAIRLASGAAGLAARLAEADPATLAGLDQANPMRLQRAWEVWRATGRGLSAWQADTPPPLMPLDRAVPLVLDVDPEVLGDRIDARFDAMLAGGALDEVRAVLPRWDPRLPGCKAIGAPELIAHLRGETSLEATAAAAKTATRQFAKRQRTWMRNRMRNWHRLETANPASIESLVGRVPPA